MLKFKNITQDLPVTQAVKHNLEYLLTKIPYTYKEMINLESIGVEDNKVVLLWINDFDEFLSVVIGEQPTFLINFTYSLPHLF